MRGDDMLVVPPRSFSHVLSSLSYYASSAYSRDNTQSLDDRCYADYMLFQRVGIDRYAICCLPAFAGAPRTYSSFRIERHGPAT